MKSQSPILINPNRDWVTSELQNLYSEWVEWANSVAKIIDQPYNIQTQSEVFADGEENMKTHDILQAKTLVFLNSNIQGHGFIEGFDGRGCDRTDLRLNYRVKHRLHRLEILLESLKYSVVLKSDNSQPSTGIMMISDEKKKRIESLSTDDMAYELNRGRTSRFQGDSYAYLKTCYDKRTVQEPAINPSNDEIVWHKKPLGQIAIGVVVVILGAFTLWVINHYFGLGI